MSIRLYFKYVSILSNRLRTTGQFQCPLSPNVEASDATPRQMRLLSIGRSVDLVSTVTDGRTGDGLRVVAWAHFAQASFLPSEH